MGAPIVVNTVKVQGTVASSGTTAILGTVSQNATWNVNAAQSGTWNIGGTVNQGGSWTVTSNVGSGTRPVSAAAAAALFVQGTTTITNGSAGAIFVQGTVTTSGGGGGGATTSGSTITQGSGSVTTVAGTILSSASTRRNVKIYNLGTSDMWVGGSTAVATNLGGRISPNESFSINDSANSLIVGISSSGTVLYSYFVEAD